MSLEGKVAIVTGGSRGIGRGISLAVAEAGADVVICFRRDVSAARDAVAKIEAIGRKTLIWQADVSDYVKVKELADKTIETFKKTDILVNQD